MTSAGFVSLVLHHPNDQFVGDQIPAIHERLRLDAERRPFGDVTAQDVAGRDLAIPAALLEDLGLRAFAGTRRPKKMRFIG